MCLTVLVPKGQYPQQDIERFLLDARGEARLAARIHDVREAFGGWIGL